MGNGNDVQSVMVEFNRLGGEGGTLQKNTPYIRTTGDERPACEIKIGLGYREFGRAFHRLRYVGAAAAEIDAALQTLETEAVAMLSGLLADHGGTTQLDIVTSAAELWAFPFEAYARERRDIVITRRIRGTFGEHISWPPVPKVLFVHAAVTDDLSRDLVDEHISALTGALRRWTGGADPIGKLLFVKEVYSLANLTTARDGDYTHIHLLAHGMEVDALDGPPFKDWGIRLGPVGSPDGVHPADVAKVLAPRKGLPVAITIASCDSANQANPAAASYSLAHELHRLGVPVVVASQLPLTMHGSVVLTRCFYEPLFCGEDVRLALLNTRNALHEEKDAGAGHDWLSVVAYVRLPETYDEHLDRVALKMRLAMLRAAHKRMDIALRKPDPGAALDEVEQSIRESIVWLDARLQILKKDKDQQQDRLECQGLLASAYKRLAELLFLAKRNPAEQRQALESSLLHYSEAFGTNMNMHWHGVQKLALQAVLMGAFDPVDYAIVLRGAQASAKENEADYWPLGTIAELYLLAAVAQQKIDPDAARKAVEDFAKRATGQLDDIDSTRRQLQRYVKWWTKGNNFMIELGEQAAVLAALLPEEEIP